MGASPQARRGRPFSRKEMVDWLGPGLLARTGLKAVVAATFGAFADKREVQAALDPGRLKGSLYDADYSQESEIVFDYVADTGDGFDSTYSLAWLVSRDKLQIGEHTLPRGRFIILGGDQVYPTAERKEYWNRFNGPWEAAYPWEDGQRPDLFALPGNHDWYDGLTSFTRLFCQGGRQRSIGAWCTRQTRSYFAVKLPHDFWLWGIDIQLNADVDVPQMEFFEAVAERMKKEAQNPRVILCTAEPAWVYSAVEDADGNPWEADERATAAWRRGRQTRPKARYTLHRDREAFASLAYFEDKLIRRKGLRLAATLSGDLHHYVRYEESGAEEPIQRVTCGGGGAYMYPTHHMPAAIELTEHPLHSTDATRYQRRGVFPSRQRSFRLRWGALRIPFRNRPFALLLGGIYLFFAWVLQSASLAGDPLGRHGLTQEKTSLVAFLADRTPAELPQVLNAFWQVARHSPGSVALALVVVFGLYGYRRAEGPRGALPWGVGHGLAHLLLAVVLIWSAAVLNVKVLGIAVEKFWHFPVFSIEMLFLGGTLGALLFAGYLALAHRFTGCHVNDVYSSQMIEDWKCFLRLRLDKDGLQIYPVGIPKVPREAGWEVTEETIRPRAEIATELIEPPFRAG